MTGHGSASPAVPGYRKRSAGRRYGFHLQQRDVQLDVGVLKSLAVCRDDADYSEAIRGALVVASDDPTRVASLQQRSGKDSHMQKRSSSRN